MTKLLPVPTHIESQRAPEFALPSTSASGRQLSYTGRLEPARNGHYTSRGRCSMRCEGPFVLAAAMLASNGNAHADQPKTSVVLVRYVVT